jgi:hypothetical protein
MLKLMNDKLNINMGKKFDKIFEAVVSRYNVGGYLPGDIVKFRTGYKSTPTYKAMHSEMQRELDELANSGLNIKVTQVGSKTYNQSSANDHKTADNVVITVAGDHGGGRYYNSITVSPEMIDIVGAGDPTPPVASQFYKDDEKYLLLEIIKILQETPYGIFPVNIKAGKDFSNMKKLNLKA